MGAEGSTELQEPAGFYAPGTAPLPRGERIFVFLCMCVFFCLEAFLVPEACLDGEHGILSLIPLQRDLSRCVGNRIPEADLAWGSGLSVGCGLEATWPRSFEGSFHPSSMFLEPCSELWVLIRII